MTSGNDLPAAVSDLTPAWLTQALRSSGSLQTGQVTAIDAVVLHGGVALMSQMSRLSLTYDSEPAGAPHTMIAKFPPTDEEGRRRGLDFGFFEGEVCFYGHLAARSVLRVPRCYFSRFDAGTGKFLILMEDLSEARLGDVSAGCSAAEAATAIDSLARLHASWWNSSELHGYPWLREFGDRLAAIVELLPEAWPTFVDRFRGTIDSANFALLEEVKERLHNSPRLALGGSRTLLHGDFKLDNLFFLPSGEMIVCDWGLVMVGPPFFDIASFISLNLDVDHRRQIEVDLIHRYLDALEARGVGDGNFDTALEEYRTHLSAFLPRLIAAGGLAQFANEQALAEYALTLRRVTTAVHDHGGPVFNIA